MKNIDEELDGIYDEEKKVKKKRKVQPIKEDSDIALIKRHLKGSGKDSDKMWYCLFVTGINVGLRAGDLTTIRVKDVYDVKKKKCKDRLYIEEEKTAKYRDIILNKEAKAAIQEYIEFRGEVDPADYLFITQKGSHPTVQSVNRFMRELGKELKIPERLGSHSLRKTFSYKIFQKNAEDKGILYTIQHILNHHDSQITLAYLDISDMKIDSIIDNLNL